MRPIGRENPVMDDQQMQLNSDIDIDQDMGDSNICFGQGSRLCFAITNKVQKHATIAKCSDADAHSATSTAFDVFLRIVGIDPEEDDICNTAAQRVCVINLI